MEIRGAFAPLISSLLYPGVLPIKSRVLDRKEDRNLDLVFLFVFKALGSLLDSIEVVSLFYNL